MINNDNIFSIEEYKSEQSTEGILPKLIMVSGIPLLIIMGILGIKNDNARKDRLKENLHILEEPLRNDFKKYTQLHKELTQNDVLLKMLNNVDKNGKYKYVKTKSHLHNDSFSIIKDPKTFAKDLISKFHQSLKRIKRKSTEEDLKSIIKGIRYSYPLIDGIPIIKILIKFDDFMNKNVDEETILSKVKQLDNILIETCKSLESVCESMRNKGYDITSYYYSELHGDLDLSGILRLVEEGDGILFNKEYFGDYEIAPLRVSIRLNMPTSITPELFLKLKKAVYGK